MRHKSIIAAMIGVGAMLAFNHVIAESNSALTDNSSNSTLDKNMKVLDQSIQANVKNVLSQYNDHIHVLVKEQTVFLSGKLPSDTDYEKVVTLVESLKGVREVNVDNLEVKDSHQPITDTYITAKIKGKLIKTDLFDKDIPSWTVGVETKNGMVFLSGTVKSEQEKLQVLQVVKSIKNIKGINDQIKVMP